MREAELRQGMQTIEALKMLVGILPIVGGIASSFYPWKSSMQRSQFVTRRRCFALFDTVFKHCGRCKVLIKLTVPTTVGAYEGGQVAVALDQGGARADARYEAGIECPDVRSDRRVV